MKRLIPLSAAFLLVGLPPLSRGQDSPAPEPKKDPNVLRGPKVAEDAKAKTLVSRDYQGKLVRLDVDPAQAALDLIELDAKEREAAHNIILERDALIDKLEAALKQAVRIAVTQNELPAAHDVAAQANVLICYVTGRWHQFAKSGFKKNPVEGFDKQLPLMLG